MSSGPGRKFDLVLVGGGLANGLIALAVSQRHPDRRIVILDANAALGAGRTWSFHGTDVGAEARALLQPMIRSSWPRQEILFPGLRRSLSTSYHTIANENFEK
ncbi:MAG: lycopene cyclase, partial [Alphaproteobacteria bacterium]|nr:lycopene cyclase [Alphaproteobacteria bacterium]